MVDVACPEDDLLMSLIAGEECQESVSGHVGQCPTCAKRLQRLQSAMNTVRECFAAAPPAAAPTPPPMIGKYFIVAELGQGGQSLVYRAVHPTLGKDLAIKVCRDAVPFNQGERDLLFAEAKLLADLDHPNLARVFDLDFHENKPFVAMEYIRGQSLAQAYEQARPGPAVAAALVAQMARAVGLAHRRGITHQDVKPANIVLDDAGRPHLIDFGLARLRHAWGTAGGQPLGGTPGFMAPEQERGDEARVGPASDVFGLGGVLYWLLTGEAPVPGAAGFPAHQRSAPTAPDMELLARAGAPAALIAVCKRALASDPADRYATADELADDLQRFIDRPRRRKFVAAVVLGVGVVLLVGSFLYKLLGPGSGPAEFPVGPQFLISVVQRGNDQLPFRAALPLRTGDRFALRCDLPHGYRPAVFGCNSRGEWAEIKLHGPDLSPAGRFQRLTYQRGALVPPAGTNLLLVCAGPGQPVTLQEIITLAGEHKLDSLPDDWMVWMETRRDQQHQSNIVVESEKGRGVAAAAKGIDPTTVEDRLRAIGQQLLPRCPFFVAVAFPQRD